MVPSLMLVIALAGTALGAGFTRARMMRRHRPRLFFVDAQGKVYTLTDRRRANLDNSERYEHERGTPVGRHVHSDTFVLEAVKRHN